MSESYLPLTIVSSRSTHHARANDLGEYYFGSFCLALVLHKDRLYLVDTANETVDVIDDKTEPSPVVRCLLREDGITNHFDQEPIVMLMKKHLT